MFRFSGLGSKCACFGRVQSKMGEKAEANLNLGTVVLKREVAFFP